ncbi:hypothetical protein QBC45DRAFT_458525 [Copromyces sp. CBS 386.78]|nr:hypothetical protein QBC45DRAFT_458525 [Copromyces sp. CBS 386.78]
MASYDPYDHPARERSRSTRRYYREERRGDDRDPRYTGGAADQYLNVNHDLIPRPREDSVEEIRRDFPPPGYSTRDMRRARSAEPGYYDDHDDHRPRSGRDYDYDYDQREEKKKSRLGNKEQLIAALAGAAIAIGGKELYDRKEAKDHGSDVHRNVLASAAIGAAGAFVGYRGADFYTKHKEKKAPAKDNKGHKNFLESALAAAGIGSTLKALAGGSSSRDDRSDTRSVRSRRSSRSRSRSRGGDPAKKIQKAAMASLIAGATEAFRVSKEPGGWKGEKAKRILTAAAGAATVDAAMKGDKAGSKLGLAEAVIGGLLGNRVLNGSKKNIEEDEKTGRSRSRSRARSGSKGPGGLAAIATAGLGTYAVNKLSSRSRSRRRSTDSYDSRDGLRDRRHRSRSRSVVDSARKGLAKLGLGNGPDDDERDRHDRRHYDDYADSSRSGHRHRDYSDDERSRSGRSRSRSRGGGTVARRRDGSVSSSDLGDSDEDRKRTKKMRGKQIITTGLAAVATIHAAHNIYQSVEKHSVRKKAVREGKLSPEDAKKLKQRAVLQDAASVGIAALGIKGAISEMKEAREVMHETREWKRKKEERHRRRLERLRAMANQANDLDGDGRGDIVDFGRRRADNWSSSAPPKATRLEDGPHYTDGNPYGASMPRTPSPPSGNSPGRR